MSSGERKTLGVRDLVEEAKKRIVFLAVCGVGLSYLMSLTSPSVLLNLPAALFLIIVLRYLSLDYDMRMKAATYKGKPTYANTPSTRKLFEGPKVQTDRSDWKSKVNSPVVEDAIEQFTRHIVSEWVTDLWYSRITPDKQGPEELVLIMNGVLGEISNRMRNINLIDLLTRDIVDVFCCHLELFRASKMEIEMRRMRFLTAEEQDMELKSVLAKTNKLHPILFSAEAEHKVLQHVMDALIQNTFKHEDLHCSLFRYIVRELLACAVIRPVLNLANPRFINERIEGIVISAGKTDKGSNATDKVSQPRTTKSPRILSDGISQSPDPSMKGVELVQIKKDHNNKAAENLASKDISGELLAKDPLLSLDTQSTRSWNSLPEVTDGEESGIQRHPSGGEWGGMLDVFSRRKNEALAPEHFDNMWAKGKHYKRKEDTNPVQPNSLVSVSNSLEQSKVPPGEKKKEENLSKDSCESMSLQEKNECNNMSSDEVESWSSSFTEDEDTISITGLDSPGVKVWDGKSKRNFSHIHHPLETLDGQKSRKISKGHLHKRLHKTKSAKKRSKSSSHNGHVWQETERTTFLLGDGQDLLSPSKINAKPGDSSEDSGAELSDRICSGAATSSSLSFASLYGSQNLASNSAKKSIIPDSFFKLRCEVFCANIVKSGSKTFAVYCISVTDGNNHNWSIKRRFQHFGELHWRLKEFPEYNLHLPPKHFLSTGLDRFVIQERCKSLDQYLKKLLQLPTVSCSIEIWDFLSVDSQMYIFSDSLSIIETLSVYEMRKDYENTLGSIPVQMKDDHHLYVGLKSKANGQSPSSSSKKPEKEFGKDNTDSLSNSQKPEQINILPSKHMERVQNEVASDPTIPSEWVPPNVSVPVLDLVDVILQLKDGGWIRRKAFWVAKQVLQLGMGDAFDDWLIEKIQLLRRGSIVASGVNKLEQILWPDGIFITKHPGRQRPKGEQDMEAEHRAKLVYELMIDKAPAAIVGLVGRKEYEHCAKDLYYFTQSSVCMKLLAFNLLKLLLLSAFPELDFVFRQLEDDKSKFGKLELS